MTRSPSKRRAAQSTDQATPVNEGTSDRAAAAEPEISTICRPLADSAPPAALAAVAEQLRLIAEGARERASSGRAEADALVGDARSKAAGIIAAAEAQALDLRAEADRGEHPATVVEQRSSWLANAAAEQTRAVEAAQRARSLQDERDQLAAQIANLDSELERFQGHRRDADEQLAAARTDGDVEAVTALHGRLAAIGDLVASYTARRQAPQDRAQTIGDREGSGELADTLSAARRHRGAVRHLLNQVWPERHEAAMDAAFAELQVTLEGNRERIAEAAKAARKPEPRNLVVL